MAKKVKKSKAKSPKRPTKRKAAVKRPSAYDQRLLDRMHATGNTHAALEAMLDINLEIDQTATAGPLGFGEQAARMAAAQQAFNEAIMRSDDLDDWIAAARKAAKLPCSPR
ncbi:hypothetical protein [Bradyrhizobium sp. 169]|uniref:hypothetical protein n=1 Tax=Bradyrhizobium sp. 169 TaxID=2782640 RepID=UPI001FF918B5|nr:hypothetical protein [Bradyrhizobium sp. 169]MCK1592798.1 hypothetical protein [Bradyrhizobium sp. 169]